MFGHDRFPLCTAEGIVGTKVSGRGHRITFQTIAFSEWRGQHIQQLAKWRHISGLGCLQCFLDTVIARDIKRVH